MRRAQSHAERLIWCALRDRRLASFKFVRQEPIGPFFADFVCRKQKLIVEVDGATHATHDEQARDARREALLCELGYRILRVGNDDVYRNLEGVLETILGALETR